MTKRKVLPLLATAAVVVVAAIGAGTASAHGQASSSSCPAFTTTEPFTAWGDPGDYFLAPGGDFEGSLTGWTARGAKIVSGNEPFYVTAASDSHSLSLPKGATAKTPSICVSLDTPDLRLFVKNTGAAAATLNVTMTYTNNQGKPYTATVAKLTAGSSWTLSPPVLFLANIQSILSTNNQTWVSFTFTSTGSFLIDDLYVDPIKHH
jgi:hypothetical protein